MVKKIISILCVLCSIITLGISGSSYYSTIIDSIRQPEMITANPLIIPIRQGSRTEPSNNNIANVNSADLQLHAASACLMDTLTGRILYSKACDTPMAMASTTKMMTCILALEHGDPEAAVHVSAYAAGMPDVQLGIRENEEYKLKDLLYSLMLESHNDTAVAIAEHIGGTVENFAAMMNEKAASIGCLNTCFVTPNGLDKGDHHSTAVDLCRIASYVIRNPEFIKIIQTPSYSFSEISGKRSFTVNNHDAFLGMYRGAIGIKTGFTGKAGYCFVGAAGNGSMTLVSAVLASGWPPDKSYKWSDTCRLMDYGFGSYNLENILSGPVPLQPIPVVDENNQCNSPDRIINLYCCGEYTMPVSAADNIYLSLELPSYKAAPIATGDQIGTAYLIVNNNIAAEYPVTAANSADEYTYRDYLWIIIDMLIS